MKLVQISNGKKTYYVNGQKFFNTNKTTRDGRTKAEKYCLNNFLDTKSIIEFDSELECNRYIYLLELQNEGKIKDLNHHLKIKVLDSFQNAVGDMLPPITYNVDFTYIGSDGKRKFEDVKGLSLLTDSRFELIKTLFDYKFKNHGWYVAIIIYREKKWIEWKVGEKKKPGKLIKKQRETIKALKKEKHDKLIEENKKMREMAYMRKLETLERLTSAQKKRLKELKEKYESLT